MPFRAGWIYPLKDATRYDDEFGAGFDHAAVPHDAEGIEMAFIVDCWIVDRTGNVHPGYNASPIPIQLEDIDIACGRPLEATLPEPSSVLFAFAR